MLKEVLSKILRQEHQDIGLYLEEAGDDFVYLKKRGDLLPVAVFSQHATLETILEAADQNLGEATNGVTFEKEE